ncbi:unnamed protein product [Protopolystoma xenopodis]|uniref:Uncharacterized protein n=1 Tax=Protopolystoma xenopodis TaxID=117903 RepID=A0A448WQJ7_9PLAT|nr:unnamed protein product [Protopolystoma xenopodis]
MEEKEKEKEKKKEKKKEKEEKEEKEEEKEEKEEKEEEKEEKKEKEKEEKEKEEKEKEKEEEKEREEEETKKEASGSSEPRETVRASPDAARETASSEEAASRAKETSKAVKSRIVGYARGWLDSLHLPNHQRCLELVLPVKPPSDARVSRGRLNMLRRLAEAAGRETTPSWAQAEPVAGLDGTSRHLRPRPNSRLGQPSGDGDSTGPSENDLAISLVGREDAKGVPEEAELHLIVEMSAPFDDYTSSTTDAGPHDAPEGRRAQWKTEPDEGTIQPDDEAVVRCAIIVGDPAYNHSGMCRGESGYMETLIGLISSNSGLQ